MVRILYVSLSYGGHNANSSVRIDHAAANCFFITVASILGTGILGLPVKLGKSGFWPFFALFVVCLLMQVRWPLLELATEDD